MIHEINNPLGAIANLVYLIKLQADDPKSVIEFAEVIDQQVAVLSGITNQVLGFHREQLAAKEIDVVDLVESALMLHQTRLTSGNVALIRDFRSPAAASVFGAEILQVISNLLLNSLDAVPKRAATIRIRIRARKDAVHITISDNGSGISPNVIRHVFEPYRTTKAGGTGLGLWVSRRIVEKHRGKLKVRSSSLSGSAGTTFRLSLPIKYAA
jgi:signal transduction histidine kinase